MFFFVSDTISEVGFGHFGSGYLTLDQTARSGMANLLHTMCQFFQKWIEKDRATAYFF